MKKIYYCITALLSLCLQAGAQSWTEVSTSGKYIWGEGYAETIDDADKQALASLISKITVEVKNDFEYNMQNTGGDALTKVTNVINTYSNSTLKNTQSLILHQEPKAHVGRWIKKSDLEKIFQERRDRIQEHLGLAVAAEKKGKADDALRNFYWAQMMLQTLQFPAEEKYTENDNTHTLITWIPAAMDDILDDLKPKVIANDGQGNLELYFDFRGNPVTSVDYSYFDGRQWSSLYSAKDGKGVLELAPGASSQNIQLKIEYAYKEEAHIDRELYSIMNAVSGKSIKSAYKTIGGKVEKKTANAVAAKDEVQAKNTVSTLSAAGNEALLKERIDKVINAVKLHDYSLAEDCFTPDGLEMYEKLMAYGKASLVGTPNYKFYDNNGRAVARAVPMSFSFSSGMRKSFVENVVFTFNDEGRIDCLAFALDNAAASDILNKQAWPEQARVSIIEFLENYKTAFALKRLDYIRTIFDDNAVIIVGKVAQRVETGDNTDLSYRNNTYVTRTRYNKQQYMKSLERCFNSNEFVNIRFANNDVVKAGAGGELYGIQIKQDYYSSNYGDTGYLFLMVDLNEPLSPVIKVRTWQPEPDPVDGLFDISCF